MTSEEFGRAYKFGFSKTIAYLRVVGARNEVVEDLAQSAWIAGWQNIYQLRNKKLLRTWINAIAHNKFLEYVNSNTYRNEYQTERDFPVYVEKNFIRKIQIDQILRKCRKDDKILLLRMLGGYRYKEIAIQDGVQEITIKIKFKKTFDRIRPLFAQERFRRAA